VDAGSLTSLITGGVGALGVLAIVFSLIVAGKLWTDNAHQAVVAGKDAIIADKDKQIADLIAAAQRHEERAEAGVLAAKVSAEVMEGFRKATS